MLLLILHCLSFNVTNSFCAFDPVIALIRCEGEVASLEQRDQAAEDALASQVKAGTDIAECTNTEPCEPLRKLENTSHNTEPNEGQNKVSLETWQDAEHMVR